MQMSAMAGRLAPFVFIFAFTVFQGSHCLASNQTNNHFLLEEPSQAIKTNSGQIRVYNSGGGLLFPRFMLAVLCMKPGTLLLPQYLSAKSIFLVTQGNATLSFVKENEEVRISMNVGDAFAAPEGTIFFYILNKNEGSSLEVVWLMDTTNSPQALAAQGFLVGAGAKALLYGFDLEVLASAFKVSREEMANLLSAETMGPIVNISTNGFQALNFSLPRVPSWEDLMFENKKKKEKKEKPKDKKEKQKKEKKEKPKDKKEEQKEKPKAPEAYNIFTRRSFENQYGWTGEGKQVLEGTNVGLFAVNLKPAAMLIPHWNTDSMEVAMVVNGSGILEISYPNGTNALTTRVKAGSIFLVPRFFPVVQIAGDSSEFKFIGFTMSSETLSKQHGTQFLAGLNSILRRLSIGSVAASMGIPESIVRVWLDAQQGSVIVPGPAHPDLTSLAEMK